ncbi:hypothetical protein Elgi_18510 [Paenibacillus elgii]|nr:hypothetical protein Elgi_18510 [Paenibacillus elgii]
MLPDRFATVSSNASRLCSPSNMLPLIAETYPCTNFHKNKEQNFGAALRYSALSLFYSDKVIHYRLPLETALSFMPATPAGNRAPGSC